MHKAVKCSYYSKCDQSLALLDIFKLNLSTHPTVIFSLGTGPNEGTKSTKDKGKYTIWIAAGVGGCVVLVIILVAFVVYRMRR